MGIAKKGSRRITVNDVPYRWVLSPDDGTMELIVELADEPGQRLEAVFLYHDLYEPNGAGNLSIVGQRRSVSPGVVRKIIIAALTRGWQPSQRGLRSFRMHDADQVVPLAKQDAGRGAATDPAGM